MPSSSRIGPCSICSSKKACILRSPTCSSPFQPMRSSSSPKRLPSRVLALIGPVLLVDAGEHARRQHGRREARAFLVGPVGDDDRMLGLDAEIVERADDFQPAEHAEHAVDTCRRSAGCRDGCRHRPAAHPGSVPSRRANIVPIWSTPISSPAASHQRLNRCRPSPSSSVSVWRLLPPATPGPIFAISISESHKRSGLIRRFSPGAAMPCRASSSVATCARSSRSSCSTSRTWSISSSIWPLVMISGGDSAMMSPVVRISAPRSNALTKAEKAALGRAAGDRLPARSRRPGRCCGCR